MLRQQSVILLFVLQLLFLADAPTLQAGMVDALVRAHRRESGAPSILEYHGDSSGLHPMYVVQSEEHNRYAEASMDEDSMSARSDALGTGVFDQVGAMAELTTTITFQDTPGLQALINANGGQPIDLVAKFYMEFDLLSLMPGGGIFDQTGTEAYAGISAETNLAGTNIVNGGVFGRFNAGNTHGGDSVLFTSGILTPDLIGQDPFAVYVPFKVSNAAPDGLQTIFRMRVSSGSFSMSGHLKVASQARILYPEFSDIFLQSGESAAAMGLSFDLPTPQPQNVPEPSSIALLAIGGIGALGSFRRKLRRTA